MYLLDVNVALNSAIETDLRAQIRDSCDACFSTRSSHETAVVGKKPQDGGDSNRRNRWWRFQTQFVGNCIDWDNPKFIGFYEREWRPFYRC